MKLHFANLRGPVQPSKATVRLQGEERKFDLAEADDVIIHEVKDLRVEQNLLIEIGDLSDAHTLAGLEVIAQ